MDTTQLKEEICKALDSKKALDVTCVALEGLTSIADWFVIASGRSTTQVKALAENLEEIMEKQFGVAALRVEGRSGGKPGLAVLPELVIESEEMEAILGAYREA